jgi:hypothetical protein
MLVPREPVARLLTGSRQQGPGEVERERRWRRRRRGGGVEWGEAPAVMQSYNTEAALGHGVLGSERHLGGIWDWCSGHEEEEKEKGTYGTVERGNGS